MLDLIRASGKIELFGLDDLPDLTAALARWVHPASR